MPQLDHVGEADRVDAGPAAGGEQPLGRPGVVPREQRDVGNLLERVLARLAGLPLDQVEALRLPIEQQVVEPQQHARPLPDGASRPHALRRPRGGERLGDISRRGQREVGERLAGERSVGGDDPRVGTGHDPPRQPLDVRRIKGAAMRVRVVLCAAGADNRHHVPQPRATVG
jgi:hypothetical protein